MKNTKTNKYRNDGHLDLNDVQIKGTCVYYETYDSDVMKIGKYKPGICIMIQQLAEEEVGTDRSVCENASSSYLSYIQSKIIYATSYKIIGELLFHYYRNDMSVLKLNLVEGGTDRSVCENATFSLTWLITSLLYWILSKPCENTIEYEKVLTSLLLFFVTYTVVLITKCTSGFSDIRRLKVDMTCELLSRVTLYE